MVASSFGCAPPERPLIPGERPTTATDEGGLWAIMDREEARLARSPLRVNDPGLERYISGIACTVGGAYCRDVRVYVVRNASFNASMAPNGMLQVWTGLLLRTENEAQLAAVIGHELGHFVARHSLTRMRTARTVGDIAAFIALGTAGAGVQGGPQAVQAIAISALFAYSRDQEREADTFGLAAMRQAGYAESEAAAVWAGMAAEERAEPARDRGVPFLATHPGAEEREQTLRTLAASAAGTGRMGEDTHQAALAPLMPTMLADEVRLRRPERSLSVFQRLLARQPNEPGLNAATGEVYRLRAALGDDERALAAFRIAAAAPRPPATAWRGIGLVEQRRGQRAEAAAAFRRYLATTPEPPDAAMIRSYLVEGT
ncbi:M48 family metallopeptidase [Elioraea sp.]|uniref:M48 family metallopeptidase n=1 Tax=Elioraea sp. TaxID=2185103 RepID=UPI0025C6D9D4|nr:M48 family metallopeptidase [Elioraea sp.]